MSGLPFDFAMRHELGSKSVPCRHEISCYWHRYCSRCSVILRFNELLIIRLLTNTVERSHHIQHLELGKYSGRAGNLPGITPQRSVFMAAMRWRQERRGGERARCRSQARGNSVTWQVVIPIIHEALRRATNWRQNLVPLIWRHVARARLLC